MQRQESDMNRSVSGDKELSRKEEIAHFLSSHLTNSQLHDVSVKEMRHYIPLFLMEVYSEKYGLYTKKVKGLWEKCPDDWRPGVPFVDPNNKLKSEDGKNCKPKKELLNQMLKYLIERYLEKQKIESVGHFPEMNFNLLETDEPSVRPSTSSLDQHSMYSSSLTLNSGSYYSAQMSARSVFDSGNIGELSSFNLDLDQEISDLKDIFGVEEPIYQPKQAVDEDVGMGEDWDPVAELKQRISQKLQFIRKQKLVNGSDFQFLEARYSSLKEVVIDQDNCGSVIDELHSLEKDIDKLRFSKRSSKGRFSEASLDQFSQKLAESKAETLYKHMDIDVCTDMSVEVPVAVQDPSLISSLNIKPRGSQPTGTIGNLHLRSGPGLSSEMQNAPSLKTDALSEYCIPVQPAEEDSSTGAGLPQDAMLTYELLLASPDSSVPFEDKMYDLQLSDDIRENEFVKPVQETTGGAYVAAPVANEINTDFGSAGASAASLHSMCVSNCNGEFVSAMSLPPIIGLENLDTSTQEFINLLMQLNSSLAFPQPSTESPMVTAQPPMAQSPMFTAPSPMVTAQPRPFPVGSQIKTGGKRECPFDNEDDDVEMMEAPSQSIPNSEAGFGSLIPTTVEELSDRVNSPSSKTNKKTRRSTWKDQA